MKKLLLALSSALLAITSLSAAELGDNASPLDIKEWIKGGPVDLAAGKGKTVYVVEFWATWCPPCRTSIPHLTEMQKKFKDKGVIFIGVTDEKTEVVKKFVEKMGSKMDYVVAIDAGKTSTGYMGAYKIDGIPHAFIVSKEGKVIWHGHPMDRLDETLSQVLADKYDVKTAKETAAKQAALQKRQDEIQQKLEKLAKAIMANDEGEATKQLEAELTAIEKEYGGILGGQKFEPADFRLRVKFSEKVQKYQMAVMAGKNASELESLEKDLETGAPRDFELKEFKQAVAEQLEVRKISPVLNGYIKAVGENGDAAKAAELARKIEALDLKNPKLLNDIAWMLLVDESIKQRDTRLALTLAKRAVDVSGGKEAGILDTYARALFDNGKIDEAISQLKRAIGLAEDEEARSTLKTTLAQYEAKAKEAK
jgi:thiol-disulfide isomerase/thioredoxin